MSASTASAGPSCARGEGFPAMWETIAGIVLAVATVGMVIGLGLMAVAAIGWLFVRR
ncbi:MAG: hypothetical protein ACJ8F3_11785 [Xanthobacteraceae bacterium]